MAIEKNIHVSRIIGLTNSSFTGNTSADCITNLYVSNLDSCSPLTIQSNSVGDVLIGPNGGVNVGIGTTSASTKLDINGITTFRGLIKNAAGTTMADLNSGFNLNDNAGGPVIYLGAKQLYNGGGLETLNWANRYVKNSSGVQTMAWENCNLTDAAGTLSLEWSTRRLIAPDGTGTTVVANWANGSLGVGTSSPAGAKLDIFSSGTGYGNYLLRMTNGGPTVKFSMFENGETYFDPGSGFQTVKHVSGRWDFPNNVNIGGGFVSGTQFTVKGAGSTSATNSVKVTNSSNTDLFLVRDDGNVGIGTASPGYNLDSRGSFNLQVGTDFYLRQVSLAIWAQTDANNYVKINRDNGGILDLAASNSASMFVAGTGEAIGVSTAAATVRHNTAVYFRRTDNYAYGYWDTVNYRLRIGSLGTSPTAVNTTLDVTGDISTRGTYPSAGGGTLNDYSTFQTSFLSISATSTTTITGFANGSDGKRLVVANNGTAEIVLKHQDVGSSAANRLTIYNPGAGSTGDYTLVIDDTVEFIYDFSKSTWRKIN